MSSCDRGSIGRTCAKHHYYAYAVRTEIAVMINTVAAKARLEAQLMELKERQDRIAQGLAEPLNPDFSEQAVQMENDIPLEGQAAFIARHIASVMRALTRIENGP